jgi:hypothetical protein
MSRHGPLERRLPQFSGAQWVCVAYRWSAGKILEEELPVWPPSEPTKNICGLSDVEDQQLCARVCNLTTGMTAEHWAGLSAEQRNRQNQERVG